MYDPPHLKANLADVKPGGTFTADLLGLGAPPMTQEQIWQQEAWEQQQQIWEQQAWEEQCREWSQGAPADWWPNPSTAAAESWPQANPGGHSPIPPPKYNGFEFALGNMSLGNAVFRKC